jgi:iron complex outermembrane recepter protein
MLGTKIFAFASTSVLAFSAVAASAQANQAVPDGTDQSTEQLQEIVVTAQKRTENLQKIPLTVTAIGGPALEERGISKVADLAGSISGFQVQEYSGIILPFLRGVGSSGVAISTEPAVGVYTDGIFYARLPSSFFNLKNVERVEVLKGPQGTLFGRNSTGGVINVITKDPQFDTKVMGTLGYGRFDAYQGDIYATGKLSDTIAADISLSGQTNDGFGKNLTTGGRYGFEDSFLARSKFLLEASDKTRFVLTGFYSWSRQSGQKAAFPGTKTGTISAPPATFDTRDFGFYNTIADYPVMHTFKMWGLSLRAQQELSFAQLVSISAYSHLNENDRFDGEYTSRPDEQIPIKGRVKLFTQEFQLSSLPGGPLSWITGLYYYNNSTAYYDVKFRGPLLFDSGIDAPASQKSLSYAAYAQATYELLPRLKLTGGLRYTSDKTSAQGHVYVLDLGLDFGAAPDTTRVKRATFRTALDYQVTDNALLYASFSRGYKAGNYNILTYSPSVTSPTGRAEPTDPEGLDAYEIGLKSDLFDRRVRLNAAAFYYKLRNPQVQLSNNSTVFYSNAGGSRVKGAEIDVTALLMRGLTTRLAATYLDSKYTSYGHLNPLTGLVDDGAPASVPDLVNGGAIQLPAIDAKGNRTPLAAKLSFNVGGDYQFDSGIGKVTLTADFYHNSGYFYEPDNFLKQKAYDLLSGQIRIEPTDNVAVRFWGKNLLGTKYSIAASTQPGPAGYPWTPAPPRTYGIAVDFNF